MRENEIIFNDATSYSLKAAKAGRLTQPSLRWQLFPVWRPRPVRAL